MKAYRKSTRWGVFIAVVFWTLSIWTYDTSLLIKWAGAATLLTASALVWIHYRIGRRKASEAKFDGSEERGRLWGLCVAVKAIVGSAMVILFALMYSSNLDGAIKDLLANIFVIVILADLVRMAHYGHRC